MIPTLGLRNLRDLNSTNSRPLHPFKEIQNLQLLLRGYRKVSELSYLRLRLHKKHADAANDKQRKQVKCKITAFNQVGAAQCDKHEAVDKSDTDE